MYYADSNDKSGGDRVKIINKIVSFVLDLVFPPLCSACDEPTGNHDALCAECLEKYAAEQRIKCRLCKGTAEECSCTIGNGVHGLICSTFYTGYDSDSERVTEKLLFRLKRTEDQKLFEFFAREAASKIMKHVHSCKLDVEECVVTYPPRSEKAMLKYGFDHARRVAAAISEYTGIPLAVTMERIGGEEQKKLSGKVRLENVVNSLKISERADVKGKTVFIFDDIVTTGSTIGWAASCIKDAGARAVIPITIARTEKR